MQRILICFVKSGSLSMLFISQFEVRLSSDSAVISTRNATSTPPPWAFLYFLMATKFGGRNEYV